MLSCVVWTGQLRVCGIVWTSQMRVCGIVWTGQMRVVPVVGDAMWRFDIMVPGDHSNVFHLRAESNAALDSWLATLQGSGCTLVRPSLTH